MIPVLTIYNNAYQHTRSMHHRIRKIIWGGAWQAADGTREGYWALDPANSEYRKGGGLGAGRCRGRVPGDGEGAHRV